MHNVQLVISIVLSNILIYTWSIWRFSKRPMKYGTSSNSRTLWSFSIQFRWNTPSLTVIRHPVIGWSWQFAHVMGAHELCQVEMLSRSFPHKLIQIKTIRSSNWGLKSRKWNGPLLWSGIVRWQVLKVKFCLSQPRWAQTRICLTYIPEILIDGESDMRWLGQVCSLVTGNISELMNQRLLKSIPHNQVDYAY